MKLNKENYLLYAVTDNSTETQIEEAILGGITMLQLREKDLPFEEFADKAKSVKLICEKYKIPLIINDNIEVAIACNADGLHVGQNDISADKARKMLGNDKIIGVSVQTVEQALLAEKMGADYLGAGAVFQTSTKSDAQSVNLNTLKEITSCVNIPVVAIGGISEKNIFQLKGTGICGVSVVSAIFSADDITKATKNLFNLIMEIV